MNITSGNGKSGNLAFDEGMCERYLLGELSESEQALFETAYFNDDSFFNRFLAVKDELLDLYSRGELDREKRTRVERQFLSTAPRRQRLAESKDFLRSITTIANQQSRAASVVARANESQREPFIQSIWRFFNAPAAAVAGVVLLLLVAGIWMIARREPAPVDSTAGSTDAPSSASNIIASNTDDGSGKLLANIDTKSTEEHAPDSRSGDSLVETKTPGSSELAPKPKADVSPNSTDSAQGQTPDPRVAAPLPTPTPQPQVAEVTKTPEPKPEELGRRTESVTLSTTSRSVTSRNTASIGSATQSVVIRLIFGGEPYSSYSVRVTTLGGATVWRASNLTTGMGDGPKSLAVTVPAGLLTRSDYIVVLDGRSTDGKSETIREYYLHVVRQ